MYLRYLPGDSACAVVDRDGALEWTLDHELLDQIRMVSMAKGGVEDVKPHPARPKFKKTVDPKRRAAEARTRARMAERRRRKAEQADREGR